MYCSVNVGMEKKKYARGSKMHVITCFVFFTLNLSHCARLPGYFRLALLNGLCVLAAIVVAVP